MLGRLIHFIKYHNAFTVSFVLLLMSSGVFAASPTAREAVVASEQRVASVDNTYIVNVDLSLFSPDIQITGVSENDTHYFVSYTLRTIDLADSVWQEVTKGQQMNVAKAQLGERDLGLYVTRQLSEVVARQTTVLSETQKIERGQGETRKVVATEYSGLVGRFLDTKEEVFPGYVPVKPPPPKPQAGPSQTASAGGTQQKQNTAPTAGDAGGASTGNTDNTGSTGSSGGGSTAPSGDTEPPTIQILGNNPARIPQNSSYSDLGAVITDNVNDNLGYTTEGADLIDTSVLGEYVVTYTATDGAGNTAQATRLVIVYDQYATESSEQSTSAASTTDTSSTSTTTEAATNEPPPDTTPPVITLVGSTTAEVDIDSAYADAGATAVDDVDGDVTGSIVVLNQVDTAVAGTYTVRFNVADSAGNAAAEVTRTVTVVEPEPAPGPAPSTDTASSTEDTNEGSTSDTSTTTATSTGSQ